jgi:hypothetical protein
VLFPNEDVYEERADYDASTLASRDEQTEISIVTLNLFLRLASRLSFRKKNLPIHQSDTSPTPSRTSSSSVSAESSSSETP